MNLDLDRRPLVLIWEVTQACELACKHCRAEATPERHPEELSTEEGKQLLADATDFGDGQLVVLSGGDPLARPDLPQLVAHGTDLGHRMTLTPSGTSSITPDRLATLADAGLERMALSLDGHDAASHDAFRGEAGSFDATVEAARAAQDANIPIQINTTVCAETVDALPAIRDLVADLDAVLWSVFFLVPVGRGRVLTPISAERAEAVLAWLHDVAREADFALKTTEAPHYRRVTAQRERGTFADPVARAFEDPAASPAATADSSDAERSGGFTGGPGGPPPQSTDGGRTAGPPPGVAGGGSGGDHNGGYSGGPGNGSSGGPGGVRRRLGIRAGKGFAFVSHTGEVYPSGFLPASAGTVPDEDVVDVYRESDLFTDLRDDDALKGDCGACEFRGICGGSRSRAYAHTGDPLASDPLCSYEPDRDAAEESTAD